MVTCVLTLAVEWSESGAEVPARASRLVVACRRDIGLDESLLPHAWSMRGAGWLYRIVIISSFPEVLHRRNVGMGTTSLALCLIKRISKAIRLKEEFVVQALVCTAAISHEDVTIPVKHLILEHFCCLTFLVIGHDFPFLHDDASLLVLIQIHLESLFLQLLDHCNVSLLEDPHTQFEDLEVSSESFQESFLVFPKQRMHLGLEKLMRICLEDGFEKGHDANPTVIERSIISQCDGVDLGCEFP